MQFCPNAAQWGDVATWAATAAAIAIAWQAHRINQTIRLQEKLTNLRASRAAAKISLVEVSHTVAYANASLLACAGYIAGEDGRTGENLVDYFRSMPLRQLPDTFVSREFYAQLPDGIGTAVSDFAATFGRTQIFTQLFVLVDEKVDGQDMSENVPIIVGHLLKLWESAQRARDALNSFLTSPQDEQLVARL